MTDANVTNPNLCPSDDTCVDAKMDDSDIADALAMLEHEKTAFEEEKVAWALNLSKLETTQLSPEKIVKLNVGGQIFATSVRILTKIPQSLLGIMFSGKWQLNMDDEGNYFIDRDFFTFSFVLNYLREYPYPTLVKNRLSTLQQASLIDDAEYYGIDSLKDSLLDLSLRDFLTVEQETTLLSWLPEVKGGSPPPRLLYVYEQNHDDLSEFKANCVGRGRTIILFRMTSGHTFGAFIGDSWLKSDSWRMNEKTNESFIFTVCNPTKFPMTKFALVNKRMAFCADDCLRMGNDIIFSASGSGITGNEMYFRFPSSYEDTSTLGAKLFTGKDYSKGVYKLGVWSV